MTIHIILKYITWAIILFLLFSLVFGRCIVPDGYVYADRMECIQGEWKRKVIGGILESTDTAEDAVQDSVDRPEEKRQQSLSGVLRF